MIELREFKGLGGADHGWLKAKHHFSFGGYYDPDRVGWGAIRVWNDDEIAANTGFPPHPHAEMEIITYVRQGAITHEDSLGNRGRTEAGDVQVMSAGSGIRHADAAPATTAGPNPGAQTRIHRSRFETEPGLAGTRSPPSTWKHIQRRRSQQLFIPSRRRCQE